jgi:DNA-binding PadR family transcriptional regulator
MRRSHVFSQDISLPVFRQDGPGLRAAKEPRTLATNTKPGKTGRVPRGHLKFGILEVIGVHPHNGYEVIKELEARGGRPSAGSVYPVLSALVNSGHLKLNTRGDRNEYSITPAGTALLVERPRAHGTYDVADIESFLAVKDANKKLTQVVREVNAPASRAKRRKMIKLIDACREAIEALI